MSNLSYFEEVEEMSKLIEIFGMYEVKEGIDYEVYNSSLNEDVFTWKNYKLEAPRLNTHKLYQVKIDINDAKMNGT